MIMTVAAARTAMLVAGLALASTTSGAGAVSLSVKRACMSDYFAFCSKHSVGSPGLRQCMSNAGSRLSKTCVSALVAAGEVSKSEVDRRTASR